jgi:hypothetical protein
MAGMSKVESATTTQFLITGHRLRDQAYFQSNQQRFLTAKSAGHFRLRLTTSAYFPLACRNRKTARSSLQLMIPGPNRA